ncbi:hypothetical protein RRG08_049297 [Elysia crispata]|uniref:Uncharacterized protein n=1 Tax=Elysia crispata TaxID=231223 RepID=A0AAE1B0K5_9GAST|nr:hypothetical protein RRG08_049297 [Elysia crispata]
MLEHRIKGENNSTSTNILSDLSRLLAQVKEGSLPLCRAHAMTLVNRRHECRIPGCDCKMQTAPFSRGEA